MIFLTIVITFTMNLFYIFPISLFITITNWIFFILNDFSFMDLHFLLLIFGVVGILWIWYELSTDLIVNLYGTLAISTDLSGSIYDNFDVNDFCQFPCSHTSEKRIFCLKPHSRPRRLSVILHRNYWLESQTSVLQLTLKLLARVPVVCPSTDAETIDSHPSHLSFDCRNY